MRTRRARYVAAAVISGMSMFGIHGLGVCVAAPGQPAAAPAKAGATPQEIAKEQVALAKRALAIVLARQRQGYGERTHTLADIHRWTRRLVMASRKTGDKTDALKALREYAAITKSDADDAEKRYKTGSISETDFDDARYRALEAQRWLAEEK